MGQASQWLCGCVALLLLLLIRRCKARELLIAGCLGKKASEGVLAGPGCGAAVDGGSGLGHSGCWRLLVWVAVERAPSMTSAACPMTVHPHGSSPAAVC